MGQVQHIVPVNEDPARPAELLPLGDKTAVLVEDLDAVILPVAHEKASLGVERQSMRAVEFPAPRSFLSPGLDELSVLIEFHDAGVGGGGAAMAVGYEDVSVGSDTTLGRLIKCVCAGSCHTGLAEGEQELAFRVEFENLLSSAVFQAIVGDPQVALFVDGDLVRAHEHPMTKTL